MASEVELDDYIKSLSVLSQHTGLYTEFAKLGCVRSLVSLLSHENTDIATDAMFIISELTDEDISASQEDWDALVNAMVSGPLTPTNELGDLYLQSARGEYTGIIGPKSSEIE